VVLTAVAALIAEMLRRPRAALGLTVVGLLVATGLAVPLVGARTTVFMGTYRIDDLSVWATLILAPATASWASSSRASVPSRSWPTRATTARPRRR
jgi:NADH:ubiquinone oxidoreductase subunit 2 (subunit N)